MADTGVQIAPPPVSTAVGRRRRLRPGTLGLQSLVVLYVGLLVLVPVIVILYRTFQPGLHAFWSALSTPESGHAFEMTAIVALSAVAINTVLGVAIALLLARYRFWGHGLLNAFVDLPVAVSPIVVGLALILVYGPTGWFGPFLERHGVVMIGAKPGMIIATAFVSLPLVVASSGAGAGTGRHGAGAGRGDPRCQCRRATAPDHAADGARGTDVRRRVERGPMHR